jgi:hypothetical protein
VGLYVIFVFGFVSRTCERQADLFGVKTVSLQAFTNALNKVARLNGQPRQRRWLTSWQHPSIAERIEFLEQADANPALARRLHNFLWGLKFALLGAVVATLLVVGPTRLWKTLMDDLTPEAGAAGTLVP